VGSSEAWIEHLTTGLNLSRIAILYQDDSYGRAGFSGSSTRWTSGA
jgi:hypothetical protein